MTVSVKYLSPDNFFLEGGVHPSSPGLYHDQGGTCLTFGGDNSLFSVE